MAGLVVVLSRPLSLLSTLDVAFAPRPKAVRSGPLARMRRILASEQARRATHGGLRYHLVAFVATLLPGRIEAHIRQIFSLEYAPEIVQVAGISRELPTGREGISMGLVVP